MANVSGFLYASYAYKVGTAMKVYAPLILQLVGESLRVSYWYKNDLRSFLVRVGLPTDMVAGLSWSSETKANISRSLVDTIAVRQDAKALMDRIIGGLVEQDDSFPHLRKLEDGPTKATDARSALQALKQALGSETVASQAEKARRAKRTETQRLVEENANRKASLKELNEEFLTLCTETDPRKRGLALEALLRRLFVLYDLQPHGSYANPGEQIDASIVAFGRHLLVESRWTTDLTSPKEVRDFQGKVRVKLDATLGLMVSMAGFTEDAVAIADRDLNVILMDGQELAVVFQGITDFAQLLDRKLRRAADRGQAFYKPA